MSPSRVALAVALVGVMAAVTMVGIEIARWVRGGW
jgi:hypothetical protein